MKTMLHAIKYFPRLLFNIWLSFSASAYIIVIYLIKEHISIPLIPKMSNYISYIIYLIFPILSSFVYLQFAKHLAICALECEIREVELASHSFLPNYLGYFFVALSISDVTTLLFVYIVVLIFTYISRALSFNPLFLLFGYQFYFVTGEDGTKIFLITKQRLKPYQDADLNSLHRINDFTFIDIR